MVFLKIGETYTTSHARVSLGGLPVAWCVFLRSSFLSILMCYQAKTVVAPLDRVKILFQASNPDFQKYAGTTSSRSVLFTAIYGLYPLQDRGAVYSLQSLIFTKRPACEDFCRATLPL